METRHLLLKKGCAFLNRSDQVNAKSATARELAERTPSDGRLPIESELPLEQETREKRADLPPTAGGHMAPRILRRLGPVERFPLCAAKSQACMPTMARIRKFFHGRLLDDGTRANTVAPFARIAGIRTAVLVVITLLLARGIFVVGVVRSLVVPIRHTNTTVVLAGRVGAEQRTAHQNHDQQYVKESPKHDWSSCPINKHSCDMILGCTCDLSQDQQSLGKLQNPLVRRW